ncbi:hypothetical protein C0J52_25151 [Blattella germanica]|nr:hypothetical protein C0J52_25151 [Blattella germanica]
MNEMLSENDSSTEKDIASESDKSEEVNFPMNSGSQKSHRKKKQKCGIIYLSTMPEFMNVTKVREIFSSYGELGRMYLQPAETSQDKNKKKKKKKKPVHRFTEGWVEFKSKRIAKYVALHLNNTRIGERKKSRFYDCLWNIKYLPRAIHQQRLRNEIAQVKREANFISHNFEKSRKLKKRKIDTDEDADSSNMNGLVNQYQQRKTDKEIIEEKEKKKSKTKDMDDEDDRKYFLKGLFGNS